MRPAAELLLIESRSLPAVLARQPAEALARPTVLPGWRVRDVVAHCGAALHRLVSGGHLDFSPEANQVDVDERSARPFDQVLAELVDAYPAAAAAIDAAGGAFDGLGLGEWVHGGDIREPLGEPDPYAGSGIELALPLLVARSVERRAPRVTVDLGGDRFDFGLGETAGELRADPATFVRLCAGRPTSPERFELSGVSVGAFRLFD